MSFKEKDTQHSKDLMKKMHAVFSGFIWIVTSVKFKIQRMSWYGRLLVGNLTVDIRDICNYFNITTPSHILHCSARLLNQRLQLLDWPAFLLLKLCGELLIAKYDKKGLVQLHS